jgi:hypothetical protein
MSGVTFLPLLVKELATFNPLPIFHCNGSVIVTSYCYFKCNEIIASYNKNYVTSSVTESLLRYIFLMMGISNDIVTIPK